jgi:hypothetical protein
VQEGDHEHWLKVLDNEAHVLRRGYYMTKLPGTTKEANQSSEETRKNERAFFKKGPWKQTLDKSRLGTDGLVVALSTGLAEMIERKLVPH